MQIFEAILKRPEFEHADSILLKARAFDRFVEAIDILKPPPSGFHVFHSEVYSTARGNAGADASLSSVEREISRLWKLMDKNERTTRNTAARDQSAYGLSAKSGELNRKLYNFALKLVAPPPPENPRDPTSLVSKIARLLGLRAKSPAWRRAVEDRRTLDQTIPQLRARGADVAHARDDLSEAEKGLRSVNTAAHPDQEAKRTAFTSATQAVELARSALNAAQTAAERIVSAVPWLAGRKERKDVFPKEWAALAEKYWHDETSPDPSEKAVRRLRVCIGEYIYHQAHHQFKKTYGMLAAFRERYAHISISRGMWQALKPFYVKRGGQNTCTCRYCENMNQFLKAARTNRHIFEVLSLRRQHSARVIQAWAKGNPLPRKRRSLNREHVSFYDDVVLCDKKSDVLRCVYCPLSVDAHKLQDGRPFLNSAIKPTVTQQARWEKTVDSPYSKLFTDTGKQSDRVCA